MAKKKVRQGSVNVFGLGIRLVSQITLESNYLLQKMDKIFHVENDPRVSEYISSIGCEEINLSHLYKDGRIREEVYQEICDAVLGEANAGQACAYLGPGNPVFLNTIVLKLRDGASKLGLPFLIYPGVSSIDTLLNDLFIPVGVTGLQVYECTHFVDQRPAIDKRVPLMLFQPSVVNTKNIHYHKGGYLVGVKILQDALTELYPKDQRWLLIKSPMTTDDSPLILSGSISELMEYADHMGLGTLLILGDSCRIEETELSEDLLS